MFFFEELYQQKVLEGTRKIHVLIVIVVKPHQEDPKDIEETEQLQLG